MNIGQNAKDPTSMLRTWLQGVFSKIILNLNLQLIKPQGNDNTFGGFPEHLRALVSHALPKISVNAVTYPTFETRGDLHDCVSRFREWYSDP